MARLTVVILLVVVMLCGHAVAEDKGFGLGVILGEPTGLNGKFWLTETIAIDGAAAWSFADDEGVQLHADVLYHKFDLLKVKEGKLPIYFGVGARIKFVVDDDDDNRFGIRVPVGIDYIFAKAPLDIFFELVPIIDLAPSTKFAFNGAVGIRYYFGQKP